MDGITVRRREGGTTMVPPGAVATLRRALSGGVLDPTEAGYDEARLVFNAQIDRRPALIARCATTSDVVEAVRFARAYDLLMSVRGGGHNVSGSAVGDGVLMIDLAPMSEMAVDAAARTATAGAGLTWRAFDHQTQAAGLATTGGVISSTGIAGLTLGGGFGYLARLFGLTSDNLLSAEMVTAAGERITAGPEEHADLFWALRGGGGNFGVVTSFTYRLHPVGEVVGGLILHPIERAGEVLAFYRDYMLTAPDTLTVHAGLLTLPEGTKVAAFVVGCIAGGREGEAMVRPLREMGAPMADLIRPMSYLDLQQLLDASYPPGLHHYWKSSFLTRLDDPAIETLIAHFLEAPTPQSHLIVERLGGAIARVPAGATAFAHREMPFDLFILGVSTDRSEHAACAAWARTLWQAMGPSLGPGAYLNYLGAETDEGRDRVTAAYGAHYPRLAAVKAAYDPENRFRVNHNIAPASRGERRASGGEK